MHSNYIFRQTLRFITHSNNKLWHKVIKCVVIGSKLETVAWCTLFHGFQPIMPKRGAFVACCAIRITSIAIWDTDRCTFEYYINISSYCRQIWILTLYVNWIIYYCPTWFALADLTVHATNTGGFRGLQIEIIIKIKFPI